MSNVEKFAELRRLVASAHDKATKLHAKRVADLLSESISELERLPEGSQMFEQDDDVDVEEVVFRTPDPEQSNNNH